MEFWKSLDAIREDWSVLKHPFYLRWSNGDLELQELATYAGEYHHAVVALARTTSYAAKCAEPGIRPLLARHAEEESSHVALWDQFAQAVGRTPPVTPTAETSACVDVWADESRDLVDHLVVLYTVEVSQPAIADVKRAGLTRFYGLQPGPATAYFDVHAVLDHEHARTGRRLIDARLADADPGKLLSQAVPVRRDYYGGGTVTP